MTTNYLELLERPVAFHRVYARIGGGAAAGVFISQLMYWHRQMALSQGDDWDGWFYKTAAQWEAETCTTRRERENAEKYLVDQGILETTLRGIPATKHYRVNESSLNTAVSKFVTSSKLPETGIDASLSEVANQFVTSSKLDCQNSQTSLSEVANKLVTSDKPACHISQSNTENTQRLPESTSETFCASVPEVADGSKPDCLDTGEPDNPDAWKSAKGKTLTPSQQKIFGQLWEAFGYKKGRAVAIDEFLKHLMPWFGKDKEFNRKNLQTLLDAIAKHVATRNLPGNTSTPLYFERWISKRRWEDDYPLEGKMSTSFCDMSPKAVGERRRPLWEIQGFDSQAHWQEYQDLSNQIAGLQRLKKLTLGQQNLLDEWQEKKVLITPKNKKQVAAA